MRKLILPLSVFALGLVVADYVFGFDVPDLFRGFGNFLLNLFSGGRS
jgi:hypothetical protein